MRKALLIAYNSLLLTLRDRKALVTSLLIPLALIPILGMALKGAMSEGKIDAFTVIVVSADAPAKPPLPPGAPAEAAAALPTLQFGQTFITDVLGSDQAKRVIETQIETDLEAARQTVASGKAAAVVYIPDSFTAKALAGGGAQLALYTDPGSQIQASIVQSIAQSFTEGITSRLLPGRLDPQAANELTAELAKLGSLTLAEKASGARSVSAMQYYAAAMAVMYMLMTAIMRAGRIIDERENGTLQRMLITPSSPAAILAGQVLGAVIVPVCQFLVLMLGTRLLFGVDWGPWLPSLLLGIAFSLAAGGIGILAASLLNDRKGAESLGGLVGPLFAALSGSMTPLYLFPDSVKMAAKFVPNYWALQGFVDQMAGMGPSHLWQPVAVLLGVAVITSGVGVARLAKK